ncbi:hypothetical protein N7450_009292 [Penicillium hetheringtonii]|nr:hypothetical protein N7450_009292 [Penicillium hetheringtonii]
MKAQEDRKPDSLAVRIGDSIEDIINQNTSPVIRNLQYRLYEYCLGRDSFRYIVTGVWSCIHSYPAGVLTGNLETIYIILFASEAFESSSSPAVAQDSEIWTIIRHYFLIVYIMFFSSNQINKEQNILCYILCCIQNSGGFCIYFEATTVANQYYLKTFSDTETALVNRYSVTNQRLLQIHAAIANFLPMAGQAEAIEKIIRDYSECSGLAPGGGTNIEDLLVVSSLSLLSESHRLGPANIPRPQSNDNDDKQDVKDWS